MKHILFTGGGSSGHVTPNLALIPSLQQQGFAISYIGEKDSIEQGIIEGEKIDFYPIQAGKLRRYFSLKNFTDIFRILTGTFQAFSHLGRLRPQVVFSKGGFVSCPVVWAAWLRRIPIIIHESDMTPGLANRLAAPFAKRICLTFPESGKHFKSSKSLMSGLPIRDFITTGDKTKGREICGFEEQKPVLMIMGGSLGATAINSCIRESLEDLSKNFQIIHICGKGKLDPALVGKKGYQQFEYVDKELPHLFALADYMISRAGATSIFEIKLLKKPNLLIPLSKEASRGDQILNANSFQEQGFSMVLQEAQLNTESLGKALTALQATADDLISSMEDPGKDSAVQVICDEIARWT